MRAKWNRKAGGELDAILRQMEALDAASAQRFSLRVKTLVELLASNPRMGSIAEHVKSDVRFFVVEPYVLYYRIQKSSVRILRLLHGSQDAACKLDC